MRHEIRIGQNSIFTDIAKDLGGDIDIAGCRDDGRVAKIGADHASSVWLGLRPRSVGLGFWLFCQS